MAKKCKICKQPFVPTYSTLQPTCTEPKCIIEYSRQVREKKEAKEWKERKAKAKVELYPRENKNDLQRDINKLSKMIDARFGYKCICCDRKYGKQIDAAHYQSVGSNSTARFNLHNIHSADSYCNNHSNTHISGYYDGLIQRYDKEYADYIKHDLKSLEIKKLMAHEVEEKKKIVRELIRNFDTFVFKDGREGREIMNKIIGIYL